MSNRPGRSLVRKIVGPILAVAAGLGLFWVVFGVAIPMYPLVSAKLTGHAPRCSWPQVFSTASDNRDLAIRMQTFRKEMQVTGEDGHLVKVRGAWGEFWLPKEGEQWGGADLLAYVMAERAWVAQKQPESIPSKGAVAVDCGAHVGTFTRFALDHGASKVIAIEPEPSNAECFRRNLDADIRAGRVVLVEKGAWSSPGKLKLAAGKRNSGTSTFVDPDQGAAEVEVDVDTLDSILGGLGITTVDYIKVDVQGAEADVLKGARELIARSGPRILLDADNRASDHLELPKAVQALRQDYRLSCGPCELGNDNRSLTPHTLFFQVP
jgi:FkbM family methyltransferase